MGDLTIGNARVVTREATFLGGVHVAGGRIVDITRGPGRHGGDDFDGDYLIPGLVELHTDVLERHARPRPGVAWPETAAVVAHDSQLVGVGITTVLDGLAVGYVVDSGQRPRNPRPLMAAVTHAQSAGWLRAEHFFHLRCEVSTEHVVEDFEPCAGDARVRLVSLMDHTPGQRQFVSLDKYREYYQGKFGLSDVEVETLIESRRLDRARFGDRHRSAIIALCAKHGLPMASHDDATVRHVEEALEAGATIAEFPTTLEAAGAARAYGLSVLVGGPNLILGGSHSGNVAAALLAERGLIDILSSDYVPAAALHAALWLHARHGVRLPEAVATVTLTPARRIGLEDRGEIAVGQLADLVRVRLTPELPVVLGVWRQGVRVA